MKFLIDIFKKASKDDGFRSAQNPPRYNDGIAKLNNLGSNQYSKLNTQNINKISKTNEALQPTTNGNNIVPGN
jgi:hypothetical protein